MPRSASWTFIAKDKFTAVAKRIAHSTDKMRRGFGKAGIAAGKLGKKIRSVGSGMKKFSMVAGAMAIASLKVFGDMEAGLSSVLTLLDDTEIKKYSKGLEKLAIDAVLMGFKIGDANKALFDTVSALGANEDAFTAFEVAQKLAIGGVTTMAISVDGLTSIMNAYKSENVSATDAAEAFFSSQVEGKVTVGELASNVGQVAPMAKAAGVGFKELLAAMSQLTLGGLSVEESATSLKGVFTSLLKPSQEAEEILTALKVPWGATNLQAATLSYTLGKLAEVQEKFPDYLARAIPNIRGFTAAASLGAAEIANMDQTIESINRNIRDGTGYVKAYTRKMGDFNQEMKGVKGALTIAAMEIGKVLAPAVRVLADLMVKLLMWFIGLGSTAKKIIAWSIVVVSALSSILAVVGVLFIVLGKGAVVLTVISAIFAFWPIVIMAAVAALIALWANFDKIKAGWSWAMDKIGFGDSELTQKLEAEVSGKSHVQVDVGINDPGKNVKDVKMKTNASKTGPKIGTNLATQS